MSRGVGSGSGSGSGSGEGDALLVLNQVQHQRDTWGHFVCVLAAATGHAVASTLPAMVFYMAGLSFMAELWICWAEVDMHFGHHHGGHGHGHAHPHAHGHGHGLTRKLTFLGAIVTALALLSELLDYNFVNPEVKEMSFPGELVLILSAVVFNLALWRHELDDYFEDMYPKLAARKSPIGKAGALMIGAAYGTNVVTSLAGQEYAYQSGSEIELAALAAAFVTSAGFFTHLYGFPMVEMCLKRDVALARLFIHDADQLSYKTDPKDAYRFFGAVIPVTVLTTINWTLLSKQDGDQWMWWAALLLAIPENAYHMSHRIIWPEWQKMKKSPRRSNSQYELSASASA